MASLSDIQGVRKSLIRKPLAGGVLFAPISATVPVNWTTESGGIITFNIPAGHEPVGAISKENPPTFTPETETSDVETWGFLEATRTDIISRNTTVNFVAQETNRKTLELYHNVDLSGVEADADTGEVQFADPTAPDIIYHRAAFVSVDGQNERAIYIIKYCPNFVITEVGEQSWSSEGALEYNITGRAKVDETVGYAVKTIICGPGWLDQGDDHGFTAASS
ncbi:major tail protein [Gordonia phage Yvonnetastic]|uniref:Major tail protein n=1 Tax=Gordonia phage Yvonnetastic TaxID=1821566 RepID=A0A142K900_9CAUD|nr:major tail protein [Gordonia phage Yvonnetastic]AMS02583.1 major tail protein [Gordonia phage Yvonnetastic]WKW86015.1 major tail protein [Gordonia Phage JonJames]